MALPTIGCDAASVEAIVNAGHHGSRVDGQLPNLGDPEQPRVFTNDMGWTITLAEGFVVTAAARLEDCEGTPVDVSLPFGPFPECWVEQDKNVTDFGYVDLPAGTYCKLFLEYGRYRSDVAATATDVPFPVRAPRSSRAARCNSSAARPSPTAWAARQPLIGDVSPPTVANLAPREGERVPPGVVYVSGNFEDRRGTGVDPRSVRLALNGRDVTGDTQITPQSFRYRGQLAPGGYTAQLTARDGAGNELRRDWRFDVGAAVAAARWMFSSPALWATWWTGARLSSFGAARRLAPSCRPA